MKHGGQEAVVSLNTEILKDIVFQVHVEDSKVLTNGLQPWGMRYKGI